MQYCFTRLLDFRNIESLGQSANEQVTETETNRNKVISRTNENYQQLTAS